MKENYIINYLQLLEKLIEADELTESELEVVEYSLEKICMSIDIMAKVIESGI